MEGLNFILNVTNNGQSLLFLLMFWILAFPRKPKQLLLISLIVTVLTVMSGIVDLLIPTFMGMTSGLFAGVALALMVGRLDSKFIMARTDVIAALYFYAILQGTWFVFSYQETIWFTVVSGIAMLLKIILYLLVSWLLVTGRLLYFFQELRLMYGVAGKGTEDSMPGLRTVEERFASFLKNVNEYD